MSTQTHVRHFLSKKAVANRNGVHTGTIDRWCRQNQFPKPVKISPKGSCRWPEQVVVDWEEAQLAKARNIVLEPAQDVDGRSARHE